MSSVRRYSSSVIRGAAIASCVLLLSACAGSETVSPTPEAPVPAPAPSAQPDPEPEPDPELEPVGLTAAMTVDAGTISVEGSTNLPDGAALYWELAETPEAFERTVAEFGVDRDRLPRFPDGEVPSGSVVVDGGRFAFSTTADGWEDLGLCDELPLELFVGYLPLREVGMMGSAPEQPESLYALHGDNGERLTGAVPPAELHVLESTGWKRIELFVLCP